MSYPHGIAPLRTTTTTMRTHPSKSLKNVDDPLQAPPTPVDTPLPLYLPPLPTRRRNRQRQNGVRVLRSAVLGLGLYPSRSHRILNVLAA